MTTTAPQGKYDGLSYRFECGYDWTYHVDLALAAKYQDPVQIARISTEYKCTPEQYQRFSDVFDALKKAGLV